MKVSQAIMAAVATLGCLTNKDNIRQIKLSPPTPHIPISQLVHVGGIEFRAAHRNKHQPRKQKRFAGKKLRYA